MLLIHCLRKFRVLRFYKNYFIWRNGDYTTDALQMLEQFYLTKNLQHCNLGDLRNKFLYFMYSSCFFLQEWSKVHLDIFPFRVRKKKNGFGWMFKVLEIKNRNTFYSTVLRLKWHIFLFIKHEEIVSGFRNK